MSAEEHIQKFINDKFPKELQSHYAQLIGAIKSGFYEGIKFERLKFKGIPGAVCPHCYEQGIQGYDNSNKKCPNCGKSIFPQST